MLFKFAHNKSLVHIYQIAIRDSLPNMHIGTK